jgi:hypothetical protein
VTQRGNRREPIFFGDGDQEIYRDLLAEQTAKYRVAVWARCLMPNHVHLIPTPCDETGLGGGGGRSKDDVRPSQIPKPIGGSLLFPPYCQLLHRVGAVIFGAGRIAPPLALR